MVEDFACEGRLLAIFLSLSKSYTDRTFSRIAAKEDVLDEEIDSSRENIVSQT